MLLHKIACFVHGHSWDWDEEFHKPGFAQKKCLCCGKTRMLDLRPMHELVRTTVSAPEMCKKIEENVMRNNALIRRIEDAAP